MLHKTEGRDANGFQESLESTQKDGAGRAPSTDVVKAT
jgi:hypothetical protein